jgi:hypothetical protein
MFVICLFLVLILIPLPAHAYLDPGSGSLLLQSLIAIVVGGWLAFRMFASNFWRKIRGGGKSTDETTDQGSDGRDDGPDR